MPADPSSPAQRLDEVQVHIDAGEFEAALALAQSLRAQFEAQGDAALQLNAEVYLVRSLVKLERFSAAIAHAEVLLTPLAAAAPSAERAELLVRMAYAQAQLSRYEASMRAAHLALQDALALGSGLMAAQALERMAMCCMILGDAVQSERFMLEALGFYEQSQAAEHMLRASSNALFLFCNVHDDLLEQGEAQAAAALLQRSQRVVVRVAGALGRARSAYMACMWRANHGRWLLRRGLSEQAEAQMREVQQRASERGWHPIRRPMNLELARLLEARGGPGHPAQPAELAHLAEAAALLIAMFEPSEAPLRDRLAVQALARLPALLRATGDMEAARHYQRQQIVLTERLRQQRLLAQKHVQDLGELAGVMLAEADQRRLEAELARLRRQLP